MKNSKDVNRAARQFFRACFDSSGRLHPSRARRIVKLLGEKKPRHYMDIIHAFQRLMRLEMERRTARVESVIPLSREMADRLRADLQKKYGAELELEFHHNPDLIGGMRVKVGSDVWDGSVRAKLQALRERLA